MIEEEKFRELEKLQDELRQKRNDLSLQQQEVQKQIDEIEIQKYDCEKYIGKVIVVNKTLSPTYNITRYMIVDKVERLFKGPLFYGKSFEICYSSNYKIGNSICMYERSETSSIPWKLVDKIDVVDAAHLKREINSLLSKFDYGEEMNKMKIHHEED